MSLDTDALDRITDAVLRYNPAKKPTKAQRVASVAERPGEYAIHLADAFDWMERMRAAVPSMPIATDPPYGSRNIRRGAGQAP